MTELPKISVVTPSYNQAEFIEETMASIHDQGYPNLEHIVIDGGSTDGSVEIIKRYERHLAHWQSAPDGGQTDALIQGFERATGDIQCWLNSDDLYEPGTLFEVAEFFSSQPEIRFAYGNSSWIDHDSGFIKPKREHRFNEFVWFWDHNFIPQPSAFWRGSLYREVGGLDRSFNLAMDADLWIRFAELTTPVHSKRSWSRMRFYPEQKNTSLRSQSLSEMQFIRQRHDRYPGRVGAGVKGVAARSARIVLKAAAGGYPPSELLSHVGTIVGLGSWEKRRMASRD